MLTEELCDLYSSPNTIRVTNQKNVINMSVGTDGEGRRAFMTLVGKSEENRQLGRPRCRQNYNIKIGHKK